jgi:hypothetical protein
MADAPLTNSPDARTDDGTLKDQGVTTPTTDSSTTKVPPTQPTTDQKTEPKTSSEDKSLITDAGKDKSSVATGAPETYADFKAPEGFEIDKEAIAKALPIFKELNISQDGAQRLVDFYAAQSAAAAEAPVKFYADMQKTWRDEAASRFGKAIEPGGAIVTEFAKAIDGHLPPSLAKSFRAALDFTGVGNHPDFIEGFRQFARLLGEGTSVRGSGPSPAGQKAPGEAPKSLAQIMYPNNPSSASGG